MVTQKGRRLVGMCFRRLQSRQPDFLLKVYKTYILSPIMYASQFWSPKLRFEVNALEAVQRRFTKRIVGSRDKSYGDRLQHCNLLSLESRRIECNMLTVFKLIHGLHGITLEDTVISPRSLGLSLCNSILRRSGVRLKQGHVINNAICNLFKYRAPQQWNSLPLNIVQCTNFISFKRKLFVYFQENDKTFFSSFKHIVLFI